MPKYVTITLTMQQAEACVCALGIGLNTLSEAKEKHGRAYIGPSVSRARGGARILERTIADVAKNQRDPEGRAL